MQRLFQSRSFSLWEKVRACPGPDLEMRVLSQTMTYLTLTPTNPLSQKERGFVGQQ